jgi:hypothetical protein
MLTERINTLVEKAEELGCNGEVEEAQGTMKLCDQLKEERETLQEVSCTIKRQTNLLPNITRCMGFEALHGEISIYIWFAVTPRVYLLAR